MYRVRLKEKKSERRTETFRSDTIPTLCCIKMYSQEIGMYFIGCAKYSSLSLAYHFSNFCVAFVLLKIAPVCHAIATTTMTFRESGNAFKFPTIFSFLRVVWAWFFYGRIPWSLWNVWNAHSIPLRCFRAPTQPFKVMFLPKKCSKSRFWMFWKSQSEIVFKYHFAKIHI